MGQWLVVGVPAALAFLLGRRDAEAEVQEEAGADPGGFVSELPKPPPGFCVVSGDQFDAFVEKRTDMIGRCWEPRNGGWQELDPGACFADSAFPGFFTCADLGDDDMSF